MPDCQSHREEMKKQTKETKHQKSIKRENFFKNLHHTEFCLSLHLCLLFFFLNKKNWKNGCQKHNACSNIKQGFISKNHRKKICKHTKKSRHNLHPYITGRAHFTFRS